MRDLSLVENRVSPDSMPRGVLMVAPKLDVVIIFSVRNAVSLRKIEAVYKRVHTRRTSLDEITRPFDDFDVCPFRVDRFLMPIYYS